ncbi:MAG TPA: hypothetical protein VNU44_20250 [Bryobacteraceae bacterium]|nr:hypothetical protein [Bryobacteraceae bacterium]
MGSRSLIAACFVFLIFASVYLAAVVELDNTNIGTTNGLWKTPMVRGWEKGTSHKLDSGEWLYLPLYGVLCRAIPDARVSYGTHGPVVTFRKMALVNAMFGGAASAVVFLLAMRFLGSVLLSAIVVLAHGCAAFVILNSVNSEDILPAYTFFVLMTFCVFAFLDGGRIGYLAGASVCCAMLTLLHWTLMIPALAGVIAVGLLNWRRTWMLPVFFALFGIILKLFMLGFVPSKQGDWVVTAAAPSLDTTPFERLESIRQIVYPSKTAPNGYLGFRWNKVVSALIGIGNYFLGGKNIGDNRVAFADPNILGWMRVSWLFAMVTLAALVWAAIWRSSTRLLAVFGLAAFVTGQMEHLYSQPQDPQSQIEPMFATILGVIVILEAFGRVRFLAVALGAAFFLEGGYNARLMLASRGQDSRYMRQSNELAQVFPPDNTVLVSQGWEEWNTWVYAETFEGDSRRYGTRNIGLVNGFIARRPGTTPEEAADAMAQKIGEALAAEHRVVANVVWVGSRENFAFSLTTLASIEDARIYADRLYGAFHVGKSWDTSAGRFVEILK